MAPGSPQRTGGTRLGGAETRDRAGSRPPLAREDVLCPVCLEIYMEPVTLPCAHTFCKGCFLESVDKALLCCPLCRRRVSSWARLHTRTRSLVDQDLWDRVQTCFPRQVQQRMSGHEPEEDPAAGLVCFPRVCEPGELRQEYEDQVTKLQEERRQLEEEQQRASQQLIQRLLQEEQEQQEQERSRRSLALTQDQQLARLLSQQLNSSPVPVEEPRSPAPQKKKKPGPIERFFSPQASPCASSSLGSPQGAELKEERPPPAKRKSSQQQEEVLEEEVEEEAPAKRALLLAPPPVAPPPVAPPPGWEELMAARRRQEEEDRRLALLLQKELDEEERRRATDRSKGSSDPYLLRGGGATGGGGATPRGGARRGPAPSSSSRSSRQTTLTNMFPGLSR